MWTSGCWRWGPAARRYDTEVQDRYRPWTVSDITGLSHQIPARPIGAGFGAAFLVAR
ncbi:hypothetical protein [Micromonospora sp. DT31]|uniref:hypothetical protein n=1 Tax=Micromonospora sp. DT31 TaxID=3393434 RepID=UPI003CF561E8